MIQAIALVLDFAPAHWSSSTRMVAVALGDYVNTDSSYAWPSVANLARRSGISTRQEFRRDRPKNHRVTVYAYSSPHERRKCADAQRTSLLF